jgi:hypothetical protein
MGATNNLVGELFIAPKKLEKAIKSKVYFAAPYSP